MTSNLPTHRRGFLPRARWVGAAALMMGFLLGTSSALAAPPPANTVIGNQASASYVDPNGANQLATSNLVQTTVQQVGSFTLDGFNTETTNVVNSKTGAAGSTVYAPHVLSNTGNGADTFAITVLAQSNFSKVEVFVDANADGLPDNTTPLCSVVPTGTNTCAFTTPSVAGNSTFPFVVAYSIPGTATDTSFPSPREATVKATATTTALYAAANLSAADKDNVSLTAAAAFNASKSLIPPAVARPSGTWPTATSGPSGTLATYTLTFSNTGGSAGRFVLTDTVPSGFTYQPGSAVWSSAPALALMDNGAETGTAAGNIDYAYDATTKKITFVVNSLAPNTTQTVSFIVQVNNTAAIGTSTTTNTAMYNPLHAPTASSTTPGTTGSPTNPSPFTVTGDYKVVIGTGVGNTTDSKDAVPGTPNTGPADTNPVTTITPMGSTVVFKHKAFNTGNATDIVNLTLPTKSNFPAGTTFTLYSVDAGGNLSAPLIDNDADGNVDTGLVAAGGTYDFALVVSLPSSPNGTGTGAAYVIVRGTSKGSNAQFDASRDNLTTPSPALVDLTNTATGNGIPGNTANGDVGPGPSPSPTTTVTTSPGGTAEFALFVRNTDTINNTYDFSAALLPTGWTVKFVASANSCSDAAISSGLPVNAGAQVQVKACVTVPATQSAVTAQNIRFSVTSTANASTGAVSTDAKTDAVTVQLPTATLTPNNSGQVTPGGSVVYAHTLTNTSGFVCSGNYTVTASIPEAGWTTALYEDNDGDGQIGTGDALITGALTGPLAVGGTKKLLVKVFAPGGATAGATASATVTVNFTSPGSCGSPTATDISTVITGQIRLVKTQVRDALCNGTPVPSSSAPFDVKPGECIVYRVIALNEGAAPVTNLKITDALPAYTSLTGATQPVTTCSSTGVSPALTNANANITAPVVSCGSTANTVNPGGSATLTFSVKVNN